jgi:hypothetical protein
VCSVCRSAKMRRREVRPTTWIPSRDSLNSPPPLPTPLPAPVLLLRIRAPTSHRPLLQSGSPSASKTHRCETQAPHSPVPVCTAELLRRSRVWCTHAHAAAASPPSVDRLSEAPLNRIVGSSSAQGGGAAAMAFARDAAATPLDVQPSLSPSRVASPSPPGAFTLDAGVAQTLLQSGQFPALEGASLHPSTRERERERTWWAHTGGGNALAFKPPSMRPVEVFDAIPCYAPQCWCVDDETFN